MDNRLKNVKEELDQWISPTAIFTEEDKRAIRRKIREGDIRKRKRNTLLPVMMSFAAACVFFLLIGGFLGDKMDWDSKEIRSTEQLPVVAIHGFNPKTLQPGTRLGELEVKSISPSARYFPSATFQALFTGTTTLSGRFHLNEDELEFYPDQDSVAANLPIPEGPSRLPTITFSNYMENRDEILELLKITSSSDVVGNVTISLYRIGFRPTGMQVDHADLTAINGTELALKETGNTGVVDDLLLTYNIIPERLETIYQEFYQTGNDTVLQGLTAEDIFLMFWQAFEFNHTVMIYELLEDSSKVPAYQSFIENAYEQEVKSLQVEFEKVKANLENLDVQNYGDNASVGVLGEEPFPLKKNKDGIWKFKYFF